MFRKLQALVTPTGHQEQKRELFPVRRPGLHRRHVAVAMLGRNQNRSVSDQFQAAVSEETGPHRLQDGVRRARQSALRAEKTDSAAGGDGVRRPDPDPT